ncbi:MAG: glutamine--fructose-6-phosphate transaminase (isomerizing) [Clostridia bacterium]|nr:glutamine--fructose-6-phosphate transaminase (isomerizing) [Clostridia bacterium]
MCGIVGYVGENEATPILIEGLRRLEYRGYDSAGIAVKDDDTVIVKEKGRIDNLQTCADKVNPKGAVGIGHTRWATHGVPDQINAHPHKSMNGIVTLVHNGIIENYMELKNDLITKGYEFKSETDTEVIAQVYDSLFDGDALGTLIKTAERLKGSYAVAILVKGYDDKVYAMKKDSPLIVGKGNKENYLASDIPAILPYTRDCYIVNDDEFIEISKNHIKVFNKDANEKEVNIQTINLSIDAAEKGGYDYFMAKEIFEQPKAVRDTVSPLIKDGKIQLPFEFPEHFIKNLKRIYIVACGSAFHVGVTAKYIIEDTVRVPVMVDIASEFRYRNPIIGKGDLCIFVSQSGETADTLASLREAKARGAFTMSIVNVLFSSIARESDGVIYTNAGTEIAVATTKAFSAQLAVAYVLSAYMAHEKGLISDNGLKEFTDEVLQLPEKIKTALDCDNITKSLSKHIATKEHMFFIGRGIDYPLCLEGALKLKEISYIHCEGYGAGELKHGTISLIENGTVVVAIATDDALYGKMISNIKEVHARGAYVIAVVKEGTEGIEEMANEVIYIPTSSRYLMPSLTVIPLQLLAYHTTVQRGLDVDKPRNLAKSVTVE